MDKQEFLTKYAVDRHNSMSLKWDLLEERYGDANLVPMWVADMDFKVCDAITEALQERIDHGVYGYTYIPDNYYEALINWERDRFGYDVKREWMRSTTNIVQALFHFIHCFTEPDDGVIILTPVFTPFHYSVRDCGRRLVTCPMTYTADGRYEIDPERFEQAIIDSKAKLYIHCSPANPAGRVWTVEEQEALFEVCRRHGVLVISDEVHQDFVFNGHKHVPAACIADGAYRDMLITTNSGSKTFNIAGLIQSNIIISDDKLRERYDKWAAQMMVTEWNLLGLTATAAGYAGGAEWLAALNEVIWGNYTNVRDTFAAEIPEVMVNDLQGTYLAFVDLTQVVGDEPDAIWTFARDKCGLAVNYGATFGVDYKKFIRLNLAATPENVQRTIDNIVREVKAARS